MTGSEFDEDKAVSSEGRFRQRFGTFAQNRRATMLHGLIGHGPGGSLPQRARLLPACAPRRGTPPGHYRVAARLAAGVAELVGRCMWRSRCCMARREAAICAQ